VDLLIVIAGSLIAIVDSLYLLRNQHIKIDGHCHFARNRGAHSELPSSSTRLKIGQKPFIRHSRNSLSGIQVKKGNGKSGFPTKTFGNDAIGAALPQLRD
jgi:hypothetical protein